MAAITPVFSGSYSNGPLIYNNTNFAIGDNFKYYVEGLEIVYDSIWDRKLTGFSDVIYTQNAVDASHVSGSIAVTLVGDLPTWLMFQLIQLAKACLGGGMELSFNESWVTVKTYSCKWENAGDFVENNELLCGGNMSLKFYGVA